MENLQNGSQSLLNIKDVCQIAAWAIKDLQKVFLKVNVLFNSDTTLFFSQWIQWNLDNWIIPSGDLPWIINKTNTEATSAASSEDETLNAVACVDLIIDTGEITWRELAIIVWR